MFEQIVNDAASRLGLPAATVSTLVRELLSLITNERTGGAEGFVDLFRRAGLGDVVTSWFGGREGQAITAGQVESALGASTLDKMAGSSGMTRGAVGSALALLLPQVIGRLTPNGVLPSGAALQSQVSRFLSRPAVTPVEPREERAAATPVEYREERPATVPLPRREERRGSFGWLPWAVAALLALVAFLWMRSSSGAGEPELALTNRDGKVTYSGHVHDESTRTAIVNGLRTTFGEANVNGDLRVDRNVKPATWLPQLDDLFGALKTAPGAELTLTGEDVKLGGWTSAGARQALGDKLHGIFGKQATIDVSGDPAADAVRTANDKAMSALSAIGTSGVSSDDVVEAMNLAIINFSTGSAEIPSESQEIIRKSAEAIRRAPAGSRIEIAGHTDNTGDPARNLALSQERAEAVRTALVNAGAPAESLVAKGYGDTRPRAPNDTEYGRFQNRRIEYSTVRGQ